MTKTENLKELNYPTFWVSPTGATHQNTGTVTVNPPKGTTLIDSAQLYAGEYAGATGLTSC